MKFNRLLKSIAVISALIAFVVFALTCCTKKNRDGETTVVLDSTVVSEYGEVSESSKKDESNSKSDNIDVESAQTDMIVSESNKDDNKQADTTASDNKNDQSDRTSISGTTKADYEVTTEKAGYDAETFQTDASASVTVKNIVVNQCLKIESVGESDGVLSVSVTNVSDKDMEYCVLKCKIDKKEAVFSFSVLPENTSAVAVEQNGMKYKKDMKFSAWSIENRIDFEQGLSLHEDVFNVKCEGNCIEIKNLSPRDVGGRIKICYKNLVSENLYGNSAYLVNVDGLKVGETKQLFPKNLDPKNGRVIYIKYDK